MGRHPRRRGADAVEAGADHVGGGMRSTRDAGIGMTECQQARAEHDGLHGELERLHFVESLVLAPAVEQCRDVGQAGIGARVFDPDDLAEPVAFEQRTRLDGARIPRLGQHDARAALPRAFAQLVEHVGHEQCRDSVNGGSQRMVCLGRLATMPAGGATSTSK